MIPSRDCQLRCVWNDSKFNNHFVLIYLCSNQNNDRIIQNLIRMGVINKCHYGVSERERHKKNGEKKT